MAIFKPKKREFWKKRLVECCKAAKVYEYAPVDIIETLAAVLEKRDQAENDYISTGAHPCVLKTDRSGAKILVKNPLLVVWMDLNTQALAFWRELMLTPSAYKKTVGGTPPEVNESPLIVALKKFNA